MTQDIVDTIGTPLKVGDYVRIVYSKYHKELIHQPKRIERILYVGRWRAYVVIIMVGKREVALSTNSVKKIGYPKGLTT